MGRVKAFRHGLWFRAKVASVFFAIAILVSGVLEGFCVARTMDFWFKSSLRPLLVWLLFAAAAPWLCKAPR